MSSVIADGFESKKGGTAVLLIDPQNDFHEGGALAVVGATADSERLAAMIEGHKDKISQICVTLDSHHKMHIANPCFWKDQSGKHPNPFTLITPKDIEEGKWTPTRPSLLQHSLEYTRALEADGRYVCCIWPEHCLIGTPGHNVVPSINKALQSWAGHHFDCVNYVNKGTNCLTEMYSGLKADVVIFEDPSTALNTKLIERLMEADRVLIGGQAKSHCVNFTLRDLVAHWPTDLCQKLVLLCDGTSSVTGFEKEGDKFVEDMKKSGVKVCTIKEAFL